MATPFVGARVGMAPVASTNGNSGMSMVRGEESKGESTNYVSGPCKDSSRALATNVASMFSSRVM